MNFSSWLITENKLEWETTYISRSIVNAIKEIRPKMYSDRGELLYYGDDQYIRGYVKKTPKPLNGLEDLPAFFDINVLLTIIPSNRTYVSGSFNPRRKLIAVNVVMQINKREFIQNLPKLVEQIKSTVRHELEHTQQQSDEDNFAVSPKWKDDESILNYYTHPKEIVAFVVGLMKSAKHAKVPFQEKVREYLNLILQTVENPDTVKKIEKAWLQYAAKRYGHINLPSD